MADIELSAQIQGVRIIRPTVHGDDRGYFIETYRRNWFPEGREMVQSNRAERAAGAGLSDAADGRHPAGPAGF